MNSDIIEFEVSQHSDSFKQEQVRKILNLATVYIQSTKNINLRAEELMNILQTEEENSETQGN